MVLVFLMGHELKHLGWGVGVCSTVTAGWAPGKRQRLRQLTEQGSLSSVPAPANKLNSAAFLSPLLFIPGCCTGKKMRGRIVMGFSVSSFSVLPPTSPLRAPHIFRAGFPRWVNENCKHLPTDLLTGCSVCGYLFSSVHSAYIGLTKLMVFS